MKIPRTTVTDKERDLSVSRRTETRYGATIPHSVYDVWYVPGSIIKN